MAKVGENMAIAVAGTERERMTRIFNDLAEGGTIKMPPAQQPWGADVGWLTDKFGLNWMVSIDKA
jgi:PhnB protein